MTRPKKIVGDNCYLSPAAAGDAADWARWLNDLEVAVPLGDEAYEPVTVEGQEGLLAAAGRGDLHAFAIVALKDDRPLGRGLLFDVNHVDRRGMLGIFLGEARKNGAHLPVTGLVDQFYSEVQAMGGKRWDTSSLIARLDR